MRGLRRATSVTVVAMVASALSVVPTVVAHAATQTFYRPADGVLHIAGHGFGHGHGMSQWGAYGGAEEGKAWRTIVNWYYASPALATKTATIGVEISAAGSSETQVLPASGLAVADSAGHSLTLPTATTYKRWRAVLLSGGTFAVQGLTSSGWVSVAPTGGTVTSWAGTWVRFADSARILTMIRPSGTAILYRDSLELEKVSGATGMTINLVTLEHYLYGVVPSEMPCSWTPTVSGTKRLDALEAQAVAARSYASWRIAHPRSAYATIIDNTFDQAYAGYSAEQTAASQCPWTTSSGTSTSASDAAVDATAHQIMVDSSGNALFAQYSASNGGFEVAGSQPYLPNRADAWDGRPTESWSSHSWTDTVTAGQLQAAYPSIGTFESLSVTGRENLSGVDQNGVHVTEQWGGRITDLTVTGTKGSVSTTGASFRSALGLMSEWFTVVVTRPTAPRSVTAKAGDAQAVVSWMAPSSDGGGGIRSYRVTASPAITPITVSATTRSVVVSGLTNDTSYAFSVVAINTAGSSPPGTAPAVTPSARTFFHPLTHVTVYYSGPNGIPARTVRTLTLAGRGGVPSSGATAVALEVVSFSSTAAGSLTVWPHGGRRPPAPQLAWSAGQRVDTMVLVDLSGGGAVDVANPTGTTRVYAIVQGYYAAATTAGSAMTAVPAYRLFGGRAGTTIAGKATQTVKVVGRDGVPSGATAVLVQLTVVRPPAIAYLQAWPSGARRTGVYDLYAPGGASRTVTSLVPLDATGAVSLSPYATEAVTMDLLGWFTSAAASSTHGITSLVNPPRRLAATSLAAGATATFAIPTSAGVPAGAASVLVMITASGPLHGYVIAWQAGTTRPGTGNVQLAGRVPITSTIAVPVGSSPRLSVFNGSSSATSLTVDVVGWSSG